jgi:hypothetical protein
VGKCQYQLDEKLAASTETRPNLFERRYLTSFDARWKTDSKVDEAAQRTEHGECYSNTVQTCECSLPLRCYVAAKCSSLEAP